MDARFEHEAVQNPALGAMALWQCAVEYSQNTHPRHGLPIALSMLVLPMVLHRRTAFAIHSKQRVGGFYRALAEDRAISVGLQERMEVMAGLSFRSLNLGLASGLLRLESEDGIAILPSRVTAPWEFSWCSRETRAVLGAAKRLGNWFPEVGLENLLSLLRVRF
jgi:hypothetical protein